MTDKAPEARDRRTFRLSKRMEAVVSLVTPGNPVCDLGCDHGFIGIALLQREIATSVLFTDINEGPLARAREHIREAGLSEEKAKVQLSDGLTGVLPGEAKTLVIAGMGGAAMERILGEYPEKMSSFSEFILSPQSELAHFRSFLREMRLRITDERFLCEDGKYYTIIKALQGIRTPNDIRTPSASSRHLMSNSAFGSHLMPNYTVMRAVPEGDAVLCGGKARIDIMSTNGAIKADTGDEEVFDAFGPVLLQRRDPLLREFLLKKREQCDNILCKLNNEGHSEKNQEAFLRLMHAKALAEKALTFYNVG